MQRISVNTFTNPNGEDVCQAFVNGLCLTREFPVTEAERVHAAARKAFDDAPGRASLSTWNGNTGQTSLLEER